MSSGEVRTRLMTERPKSMTSCLYFMLPMQVEVLQHGLWLQQLGR
jgi:hypothetical protein